MRRVLFCGVLLCLTASTAAAQVQVGLRLEKARYLAGEPVVVFVDVRNVGDEAVGYSACDGDVRLEIRNATRRVPPNIVGCFGGFIEGGSSCGVDHPPLLQPGQTTTFRYLLEGYDLAPGEYELSVSGKAGVRSPPPRQRRDSVVGAQFDRTLSLNIVRATDRELRAAFAPLVVDAEGADPVRRHNARAAITEAAPPFLISLIARFAAEDQPAGSIDALRRIGTMRSRTHLKNLIRTTRYTSTAWIALTLGRMAHRDDIDFLAGILRDELMDDTTRRYAALGLGHVGGDRAVRHLERALAGVPSAVRPSIATALGNTRSRAAVPILMAMFGDDASQNDVCGALTTLTHRSWCPNSGEDPASTRTMWLGWWRANGPRTSIHGPENCPAESLPPPL